MKAHPDTVLDLRGSILPMAMLEVTTTFGEMKAGGIMEILVGDQETKTTLFKVLRAYPYELLELDESNAAIVVRLKKGQQDKAACAGARPVPGADPEKKTIG